MISKVCQLIKKKCIAYSLSFLSLMAGVAIYVFLRDVPHFIEKLLIALRLSGIIEGIRNQLDPSRFADWFLYGLPDLLWMFSFTMALVTIWDFTINRNSLIWLSVCLLVAISFEILQSTALLNGVFDPKDLVYLLVGAILPLLFTVKNRNHAKNA